MRGPVGAGVPTRILILSASGDQKDVLDAVKAGALGYLVKSAGREEFIAAVRATAAGDPVFTPGLAGLVLGEFRRARTAGPAEGGREIPELTDRETEILRYVATGMGYKEIAATLFLSHRTVQNHVQNIFGKLQMHNRVELARFAMERGLDLGDPARAPDPGARQRRVGSSTPSGRLVRRPSRQMVSGCGPGAGCTRAATTLSG